MKIIGADQAADLIADGDHVLVSGSGGGHAIPEKVLEAIEARYLAKASPKASSMQANATCRPCVSALDKPRRQRNRRKTRRQQAVLASRSDPSARSSFVKRNLDEALSVRLTLISTHSILGGDNEQLRRIRGGRMRR